MGLNRRSLARRFNSGARVALVAGRTGDCPPFLWLASKTLFTKWERGRRVRRPKKDLPQLQKP